MRRHRIDYSKFIRFIILMLLIIALIVVAVVSCINLSGQSLNIGISQSSRPLAYLDERNAAAGFEVEYARLLGEKLEDKVNIKFILPENMAESLENGDVDAVVSVRQSVHDYILDFEETGPFIQYGLVLTRFVNDDSIEGEDDLAGKRVGVIANSDAELLCEELLQKMSMNLRLYDYEVQPFQDLELQKNDAVISDELFALYMQTENSGSFHVLNTVYNSRAYGVRLSDKLDGEKTAAIEDAVGALLADEALDDLYIRWFGINLSP